jgi:hypothetical protein
MCVCARARAREGDRPGKTYDGMVEGYTSLSMTEQLGGFAFSFG